jgi:hypothetical protein
VHRTPATFTDSITSSRTLWAEGGLSGDTPGTSSMHPEPSSHLGSGLSFLDECSLPTLEQPGEAGPLRCLHAVVLRARRYKHPAAMSGWGGGHQQRSLATAGCHGACAKLPVVSLMRNAAEKHSSLRPRGLAAVDPRTTSRPGSMRRHVCVCARTDVAPACSLYSLLFGPLTKEGSCILMSAH